MGSATRTQVVKFIRQGEKGDDGTGILSVTVYYLATSAASGVTRQTSGWTTSVQTVTATKKYLWSYQLITYTDGSTQTTDPVIVGTYGEKGEQGAVLRGPQAWNDCATGYAFQSGDEGEAWKDVVLYNGNYYSCTKSHTKTESNYPGSTSDTNNGYWQLGDKIELVAAKILLAAYALVENLGVTALEMKDSDGNVVVEIKDGNVTCNTGTFMNVVISGTLQGVTGTFKNLSCVDGDGNTVCEIRFDTSGSLWFNNGDLLHQGTKDGRSLRFYSSDIWCRGQFGAAERNLLVVHGSYGYYYTDGATGDGQYISFSSGTDSSGNTYYTIPLYGQANDYAGFPVDTLVFCIESSTVQRYRLTISESQRVLIVNANNNYNNAQIYVNGSLVTVNGGTMREIVALRTFQRPQKSSNVLGAGIFLGAVFDNDWTA